jgi:hypothetical protein
MKHHQQRVPGGAREGGERAHLLAAAQRHFGVAPVRDLGVDERDHTSPSSMGCTPRLRDAARARVVVVQPLAGGDLVEHAEREDPVLRLPGRRPGREARRERGGEQQGFGADRQSHPQVTPYCFPSAVGARRARASADGSWSRKRASGSPRAILRDRRRRIGGCGSRLVGDEAPQGAGPGASRGCAGLGSGYMWRSGGDET